MSKIPVALTIAGSDSGGGAGIQADLRTFAFHCVHGTSAITCVTAQNTLGVTRVDAMSPAAVVAQIEAIMSDIGAISAKTGMLLKREIIEAVVEQVEKWQIKQLVVDPVMVSRTGAQLIDDRSIALLRDKLIPKALIVTPNRYEAQLLSGSLKGGGMAGDLRGVDVWFDGDRWETLATETVETTNTHHKTGGKPQASAVGKLTGRVVPFRRRSQLT
jgi:hydroxymethylpyrimidine/phosphomethylpyrimidine kinase